MASRPGSDPPLAPPPALPPLWGAVLHLLTPLLQHQADRSAVRLVCREWRAAADSAWQAACFTCLSLPADATGAAAAAARLLSPGAFVLPHLSELALVELRSSEQLQALLRLLSPAVVPMLRRLALSAPLAVRLQDGGQLRSLQLPRLQHLALDDIELAHGLASLTHLQQLTGLAVGLSASPFGRQQGLTCAAPAGVGHLSALRRLQVGRAAPGLGCTAWCWAHWLVGGGIWRCPSTWRAHLLTPSSALPNPHALRDRSTPAQALELPQLGEAERCSLSLLTSLTRLEFGAAGRGAVGPSLRTLRHLAHLHITLAHVHEHFIVMHPLLDWAALRQLGSLRRLAITHLAAYSFFPAPEATWSQEAPLAAEVERLLAALPGLEAVQLRWGKGGGGGGGGAPGLR